MDHNIGTGSLSPFTHPSAAVRRCAALKRLRVSGTTYRSWIRRIDRSIHLPARFTTVPDPNPQLSF